MARASRVVIALVGALVASGVGCSSLLGDFTSGGAGDAGFDGTHPSSDGATSDGPAPSSDASDASADTNPVDGTVPGSDASDGSPEVGGDGGSEGAVDAAPDAGQWTPRQLDMQASLALWLQATTPNITISNGVVGEWDDSSQFGNNATNTAGGPALETGVINGHDAVHFNARSVILDIADAKSLQFGTDQFLIAVVARASTGGGYFFSKATTSVSGFGAVYTAGLEFFVNDDAMDDAGNTIVDDAGVPTVYPAAHIDNQAGNEIDWLGPAFEDNAYHIVILRRLSPQELSISVDMQATQTQSTGQFDVTEKGTDVILGGVVYGNRASLVDLSLAEMIVEHPTLGVVPDKDVGLIQTYLSQKYAIK